MQITIVDHKAVVDGAAVAFRATPNRGSALAPQGIIVHDTGGDIDGAGSVGWLCNPTAKASAHVVVHRDGRITQLAPFNVITWHAGASSWRGRPRCNEFTVGIEIANPGRLANAGPGTWQNGSGYVFKAAGDMVVGPYASEVHGRGSWLQYSGAQLATVTALCIALREAYPAITFIAPHWEIAPGRKVDTGPQFPLEELRDRVLFDGRSGPAGDTDATTTAGVNQRRWPSLNDNVIQVLPKWTRVKVIRSGIYENGGVAARWHLVEALGHEGWVHGANLALD